MKVSSSMVKVSGFLELSGVILYVRNGWLLNGLIKFSQKTGFIPISDVSNETLRIG